MRLIDADAYMEKVEHEAKAMPQKQGETFVILSEWIMEKTPSVKPKQGKWIRHENSRYSYDREQGDINAGVYYTCSECNYISPTYNFCPNCGSRNREE